MVFPDDKLEAWLEALTSGDYVQTTNVLCRRINFPPPALFAYCCMGVAGRILGLSANDLLNHGFLVTASTSRKGVFSSAEETVLSRLNDIYQLTFPQIAAFVRGADQRVWDEIYVS